MIHCLLLRTLGPLARLDLRDTVNKQVTTTIKEGANLILGGKISNDKGFFYPATLISDVTVEMLAAPSKEEIFGPVVALYPAQDENHAIQIANNSSYGLAGAVFTKDLVRGEMIARDKIEVGSCFVNSFVASDPRLPFGGIKESGYGRELSIEGMLEFVNIKTIAVSTS